MSLSKYYENSTDFEPEKIVKTSVSQIEGWQPESRNAPEPFRAQQIATPHSPKPVVKETVQEAPPVKEAPPSPNQQEKPTPPQKPAPPPPPPVDMSKYILIEEAEAKAKLQFEEGVQEGLAKAASDYGSAANMLSSVCDQLDTLRETLINNSSTELKNFALAIAEKVIRTSIAELDQTIVATVVEALQRAVKSDAFTIFVNPEDYDIVNEKSAEIISGINGLTNIILKADPSIEKGGAKIESDNCIIDATIASQFDLIREEILQSRE